MALFEEKKAITTQNSAQQIAESIYKKMSPAQKWVEVCRLRQMAWNMKEAGLRSMHPEWTEEDLHQAVKRIFLYAST